MPDFVSILGALLLVAFDPWDGAPSLPLAARLAGVAAAFVVPSLAARVLRRRLVAGAAGPLWLRLYALYRFLPLALFAVVVHAFTWPALASQFGVPAFATLRAAFALLPYLVLQILGWRGIHLVEGRLHPSLGPYLSHQARGAAFLLLPYGLFQAILDVVERVPEARVVLGSVTLVGVSAFAILLVAFVGLFPFFARWIWKTKPLRGDLRARLDRVAGTLSFRARDVLVWDTAGMAANAAIVGLFPRARYVVITDALLEHLPAEEVEAVFGHEVGHARRHHLTAFFVLGAAYALAVAFGLRRLGIADPWVEGALLLLAVAAWWALFGYASRRFELEADLFGVAACGDLLAYLGALERVGRLSGRGRWHGSWRHFSVGRRLLFLQSVAVAPQRGRAFLLRMRRSVRLGFLAFAVALLGNLADLAPETPREIGVAALRLGRFETAERWLARASARDEAARGPLALARLGIEVRAEVGGESLGRALVERGREAFVALRFEAAARHLALAAELETADERGLLLGAAARRLAEGDRAGLDAFLRGEGRLLLEDEALRAVLERPASNGDLDG